MRGERTINDMRRVGEERLYAFSWICMLLKNYEAKKLERAANKSRRNLRTV